MMSDVCHTGLATTSLLGNVDAIKRCIRTVCVFQIGGFLERDEDPKLSC